jgi:hypothetical protein
MRMLDLTLTSEALEGYNNEFFEMLKTRQPLCLSSITTLHLSLSSNSTDFLTVLTLLGDAQITKLTIMDSIKKIYSFLCPFHQLRSITHLILHVLPTQPLFWSSLLRTWDQLTMIHIKIDGESEIEDYGRVFGNIRRLPLLQELHADCVGSSDTQETFHFPSLTTLSVTFAPNSEPTGFIDNLDTPRLSRLSITAGHYWDEPTFANLFHHISTRCNRASLIALVVNFLELEWDYSPDVPEEFREAAFNEATVSSLYSFSLLEHLEIRPGISCHGFSDTFYGIIPLYWPRLRVFHLGGDLFYPASIPLATLAGVASFLSNSQEIQELSLPHIRGDTLPPADKTHSTLKRIGNLFGGCEVLPSYLDWVNTCLPSVVSVGIANRTRLNFDIDPECHRYSIVPGCVKLLYVLCTLDYCRSTLIY